MFVTPAERQSALAYAQHSIRLSGSTLSHDVISAANAHERGDLSAHDLLTRFGSPQFDEHVSIADGMFVHTVALAEHGFPVTNDLAELQAIHRGLTTRVYADAGQLRTHDALDSTDIDRPLSVLVVPSSFVATATANTLLQLQEQHYLQRLDRAQFITQFTAMYDELACIHIFDHASDSTLRIFMARIAHTAGWDIDWQRVTPVQWQQALLSAARGSRTQLEQAFNRMMRPANPTSTFLIAGWEQGPAH